MSVVAASSRVVSCSQKTQATVTTSARGTQCTPTLLISASSQTEEKFPARKYRLEGSCIPASPANHQSNHGEGCATTTPHICTVCKQAYRTKRSLALHMRIHSGKDSHTKRSQSSESSCSPKVQPLANPRSAATKCPSVSPSRRLR
ncbi:uncharacterized protein LOC144158491 isoform X3 [Haemaphysalis longicornis]